jgi:hypothetical protein
VRLLLILHKLESEQRYLETACFHDVEFFIRNLAVLVTLVDNRRAAVRSHGKGERECDGKVYEET